jgi:transcription-repair coupling factor (superfamily II helicase)
VADAEPLRRKKPADEPQVFVPRETWAFRDRDETVPFEEENEKPSHRAPAYLPLDYIREPQQRIEFYRKLAQALDKTALEEIKRELRDRFGPLPLAGELLLQVTELKILAGERKVSAVESDGAKLKLTRNKEPILVGGKFPRLAKKEPRAKLNEIKKLLLAL